MKTVPYRFGKFLSIVYALFVLVLKYKIMLVKPKHNLEPWCFEKSSHSSSSNISSKRQGTQFLLSLLHSSGVKFDIIMINWFLSLTSFLTILNSIWTRKKFTV